MHQILIDGRLTRSTLDVGSNRTDLGSALLPSQERLWFLTQLEPDSPVHHLFAALRLSGRVDAAALSDAITRLTARHPMLRARFYVEGGIPVRRIDASATVEVSVIDHRNLALSEREAALRQQAREDAQRPFELAQPPLLRCTLVRQAETESALLVTMHRLIADERSLEIFLRELPSAYGPAGAALRPLTWAMDRAVVEHGDSTAYELLKRDLDFWRNELVTPRAVIDLPTDHPRPATQSWHGARESGTFSKPTTDELRSLGAELAVDTPLILLAAYACVLHRYTRQEEIFIGTRAPVEEDSIPVGVIAPIENTIVLRVDLSGSPSFREVVRRLREARNQALAHATLPFETVLEALNPERDLSRMPLYQVGFNYQEASVSTGTLGGATIEPLDVHGGVEALELSLRIRDGKSGLTASIDYNTDLFDAPRMARMVGHLQVLLRGAGANPDQAVTRLPLLSETETHRLMVEWNETAREYPKDMCIHQLFERQVERTPDAVALECNGKRLSYRQLNDRANQLAWHLRTFGVGADSLVGLCVERSLEMVIATIGILKAGGAYLPLDPNYPPDRLAYTLEDAQAKVLVTQESLKDYLKYSGPRICIDSDQGVISQLPTGNLPNIARPENLAYIIYTSGSTGKPKGVMLEHRNSVMFIHWCKDFYTAEDLTGVLASTSLCFDLSIIELFFTLTSGGRAIVVENALSLANIPESVGVKLVVSVPSAGEELMRRKAIPASVRTINLGGEPFPQKLVDEIYQNTSVSRVVDVCGPTETTTYSVCKDRSLHGPQTLGRPIYNTQLYIVDPLMQPVPVGVPGEMYIGGDGLSRGYLNRPDLTAERFIPNLFSKEPGARLYRTGDIFRYTETGDVEFLGRVDHQVKIRGFRIELGEIETTLMRHSGVRQNIVIVREDTPGEKRLVAYLVAADAAFPPALEDLRAFLKGNLPEYMVPSAFVLMEKLPLNANGKIDRKVLPSPDGVRLETSVGFVAPTTATEKALADCFSDTLGVTRVGLHDNFFDLGGHSLIATRLMSRIRSVLSVELPVRAIFETPTVAGLAERLASGTTQSLSAAPIPRVPRDQPLPLSFAQQRLWFLEQYESNSAIYNIALRVQFKGRLEVQHLYDSLNAIVARHEALRTTFRVIDGEPRQIIAPQLTVAMPVVDLSAQGEEAQKAAAEKLAREEAAKPFDLTRGPLERFTLLRLGEDRHALLLTIHHIVSDGWSMGVFFDELSEQYSAACEKRPAILCQPSVEYADYAVWQRQYLSGELLQNQLGYWKQQLAGAPALLEMPTDFPRPPKQRFKGAYHHVSIPSELAAGLEEFSRKEGATLYMTLLAALNVLLWRYSRQEDIVIGSAIAGRGRAETESLIGFFVNTLPLRTDLSGNPTVREILRRVRDVALGAYAHQELPFEKLVEELQPRRSLSYSPLLQVVFVLQNTPSASGRMPGLKASVDEVASGTAKFDLMLSLERTAQGLQGHMEFCTDLFDQGTIERLMAQYAHLLVSMISDPNCAIAQLPLIDEPSRQQLVLDWNQTQREFPVDSCIHEIFEQQVNRSPDAAAIVFESQELSYRQLNERANQLAHHLRSLGVGPDTLVALFLERSPEMIITILAILKAGGAYVPLDPAYPVERLAFMLADANAAVLVTQSKLLEKLPSGGIQRISLDTDLAQIESQSSKNLMSTTGANNLAYVMYTSGSTGTPKGVMIEHRGVVRLVCGSEYAKFSSDRVFLQLAPLSFDASTFEVWGALLNGGRCVVCPARVPSFQDLGTLIAQHKVTTLWLTSSLFNAVMDQAPSALAGVEELLVGGEALSVIHVQSALEKLPRTRIINGYGPTESTTFACCYRIPRRHDPACVSIPIGRPIANTTVYILDEQMQPVPIGVPGELYIGGAGLARGYLNRPELTAERFVPNPFASDASKNLYKTGDLVRYLADGNVEFLGRLDQQVKIRGFRIEPGEIEAQLIRHPAIKQSLVMAREDVPGDKRLVSYVVPADAQPAPTSEALRAFLKAKFPEHMVPSAFVIIEKMPLTGNGKVDRKALPQPKYASAAGGGDAAKPTTPTQIMLASIWQELLNVREIGLDSNFFDLGGHSLLAVRMSAQVEEEFGVVVPLAAVLAAPTIRELALALEDRHFQLIADALVPLQPEGSRRPIFFLPGLGGHVMSLRPLARLLGADQPVYGLQPRGLDGQLPPHRRIEEIAAYFIEAMRKVAPTGPYYVAGFSAGGLVAYEIAQQLRRAGESLGLVAMLDTYGPGYPRKLSPFVRAKKHMREMMRLGPVGMRAYLVERFYRLLGRFNRRYSGLPLSLPTEMGTLSTIIDQVVTAWSEGIKKYKIRPYAGKVHLFRALRQPDWLGSDFEDPMMGWKPLCKGGMELLEVPGDHLQIVKPPEINHLASQLRECLDVAHRNFQTKSASLKV